MLSSLPTDYHYLWNHVDTNICDKYAPQLKVGDVRDSRVFTLRDFTSRTIIATGYAINTGWYSRLHCISHVTSNTAKRVKN